MIFILKIIAIGTITGVLSGFLSTLFLNSLFFVTELRVTNPVFILFLPVFGLFSAYLSKKIPSHIDTSISDIRVLLSKNKHLISPLLTPFIFITSIGTHLLGGSAGREGVGVLMGASISSFTQRIFNFDNDKCKSFVLYSGMAAGFSSIFGTPIAAIVFVYEIEKFKRIKDRSLLVIVITASLVSYYTTKLLGLKHIVPNVSFVFDHNVIVYVFVSGLACGLGALLYFHSIHFYKKYSRLLLKNTYINYFITSIIIVSIIFLFNAFDYTGIGATYINESFETGRSFTDFVFKLVLTTLTLGVGYKGGEVTPLLFMGSSLSNSVLSQLGFNHFALSSSIGMFAFFGAATATPIAAILMAFDLFGIELALVCLPACLIARSLMRNKSFY